MQKLRIAKEDIKQDNSGNYKTVYFLDIVENNSAKNLTNGNLFQIEKELGRYQLMFPKALIERKY